ncbi:hypothetical protein ES703_74437 [subsurface metagenome]
MFYTFSYTPSASDAKSSPYKLEMQLTAGIIHQVDVLFQNGCNHEEFVQIFNDNVQVWPSNRGEKLRGNATVVSFREFYELSPGNSTLTAVFWTTLTEDFKEITISLGLLPRKVLQPLSFEELLTAAVGIE